MNKIFSKIVSIMTAVFIISGLVMPAFSAQSATAATFNNDPQDSKTLQIGNATKAGGTFNWSQSTTADANDTLALMVYYHNTSGSIANNTKIRINLPTKSATSQTISTNVWADNASSIYDLTMTTISSSQTISLVPGSVQWYPNRNSNIAQSLPSGQNGDAITSFDGLNIGNIAGGWSTQGYLTLKVKVSNNQSITTSAPSVTTYGATGITTTSATLNGIVNPNNGATTASFEYGTTSDALTTSTTIQNFSASNSSSVASVISGLSANTTYYFRISAQNSTGTTKGSVLSFKATDIATVNNNTATTGKAYFNDDPQDSKTLQIGNIAKAGGTFSWSSSVSADANDTLALMVYYHNTSGSMANNTKIRINLPTKSATSQTISTNIWADNASSIYDLTMATIPSSQTISLVPGSVQWYPNRNSSVAQSLPSGQNGDAITSFDGLNIGNIAGGWSTQGYLTLKVKVSNNQSVTISAPSVTTYGATGITTTSATLNGIVNPNNGATTASFEYGTTSDALTTSTTIQNFSASNSSSVASVISGLSANTTYYFRISAQNSTGTTKGSVLSFTTPSATNTVTVSVPAVTTNSATSISIIDATLNATFNPNNASATAWFEYGTTSHWLPMLDGGISFQSKTPTQSFNTSSNSSSVTSVISGLSANTTYYFRAVAQNSSGTTYGSVLSFVTSAIINTVVSAPFATTNPATNIATTSATLNGVANPNNGASTAWFEYGTSANSLSSTTPNQGFVANSGAVNISSAIPNLSANTTYYFRTVAQNSAGTTYGSTLSFVTLASVVNPVVSAPAITTNSATNVTTTSATINGIVNPNNALTSAWIEYGIVSNSLSNSATTQNFVSSLNSSSFSSTISNLSANTTYYFRAVANNSSGTTYGSILSLTTLANSSNNLSAPAVTTNSATGISTNSVTLNGIVNPNNASTSIWFEYGASSNSLSTVTPTQSFASGSSTISFSSGVSSLNANTTYYFRAVANNSAGTNYGSVLSFTTSLSSSSSSSTNSVSAPLVTTYSASSITSNSANLNSIVNPSNASTSIWFEYGTTSNSLSTYTTKQNSSISSSASVSSSVSNLNANTTYYFRAVANNSAGTVYGATLSFTTALAQSGNSSAPLVTTNSASSITAISANLNGTINPNGRETNVWFEYGKSSNAFGSSTGTKTINGTSYVPVTILATDLAGNTTYYFRPVARNSAGTTYGAINNFFVPAPSPTSSTKTSTTTTTTTPAKTNVAVTKPTAFVEISQIVENLTLPNGSQTSNMADVGDRLKYTITLKNIGGTSASGLKISTQIPTIFRYKDSEPKSSYDSVSNTISWNISALSSGSLINLSYTIDVEGGLNTTVNNQAMAHLSFANLNIYSNSVSTLIGKQQPASLKLSVDKSEVAVGEVINYSVVIVNTNSYAIKNVAISIGLPENAEFVDSNFNLANKEGRGLIADIGNINTGEEITKNFSIKVGDGVKENDILTTVAMINYQNQAGDSQPILSVSVSSTVVASNNLVASIFGSIPRAGWFLFISVIAFAIIIIAIIRGYRKRFGVGMTQ